MKKKVNLFVIGASKCGTTTLWNMLNNHPEIFMSTPKEPWFFSFSDYKNNLKNYECLFESSKEEIYLGEASPIYSETTLIPEIPERIYNYNPDAKIIFLVRNPIDRIKSVWRQTQFTGHDRKSLYENYCDVKVPLMPKTFEKAVYDYPPFIEASKYWTHTSNYLNFFPKEQVGVFFFEDLKKDSKAFFKEVCDFLALNYYINEEMIKVKNASQGRVRDSNLIYKVKQNKKLLQLGSYIKKRMKLSDDLFKKEIEYEILINELEQNKILEILESEVTEILRFTNKPLDYWKL